MELSFLLNLYLANTGKPHSVGGNLLLLAVKDVTKAMFGLEISIWFCFHWYGCRMNVMANNMECQKS